MQKGANWGKLMKHVLFLSFGKDSMATLILIKYLGLPLDEIVYVDVRYTKEISGEHPLMAEWIPTAEKILLERFGVSVRHLTAKHTFKDYFYTVKQKGKDIGDNYGFPYIIGAWCNSRLKTQVIDAYLAEQSETVCQYVGIAFDEPKRYERLKTKENNKIIYRSILYEYRIKEKDAFKICQSYYLVSPVYNGGSFRGGCWFCVKQCLADLYDLWLNYPTYYAELAELEKDSFNTFKPNISLLELEKRFMNGYIPKRRKTSVAL